MEIEVRAKKYSATKYFLSIAETIYLIILLLAFSSLGLSKILQQAIVNFNSSPIFTPLQRGFVTGFNVPTYLLAVFILYYLLNFPFNFYESYKLERKFTLSNQKLKSWFVDQFKSLVIAYIISLIMVSAFYFILRLSPKHWWFIVSLFWIFFNLILARLVPIIIIPLFFKYKKLSDEILRQRILALAQKMKVKLLDCFEIDFSKKTLKANAAFVGWGKTRRVILADTLKDKYSYDEIEVILAHEFSHYKLKHLLKLILINSSITVIMLYIIFKSSTWALNIFGLGSLEELSSLPIVFLYFVLFGIFTQPFTNFVSRIFETQADLEAVKVTGLKEAFISTMDKLASQNLSDRKPHPLIKLFFFDHPPIDERIVLINKAIRV